MTERILIDSLIAALKADPALRGAVIFKHNDGSTAGIPDLSVSVLGNTSWIEVKYLRKGKRLKDIIKSLQVVTCHQLATTCNGRAWIVVYEDARLGPGGKKVTIWQPRTLANTLWPRMVTHPGVSTPGVFLKEPVWYRDDEDLTVRQAVNFYGAVHFTLRVGQSYDAVVRLVGESTRST